ncbi:uncharacterized protein LOC133903452 [Phragmites australis]|uniref:uncharacterized protein LOC133903452 n=1 Tax=Phragmites australis TaxID=29695 RepID=UPI002D780CDE|nr:uncharacterized protein LOC133903452 [Phragmites australis]
MAELATGAVSSLLGVIRNEMLLLGRVRGDVQFIKEEMESMNSFLLHLARTAPPGGENDEQVRTWMNQVRLLAHDCNNCIDFYLYRPDIHLARGCLRRYLLWAPCFVQKMVAQHRAAVQLRSLRDRARDVGERRLRYGVEVPATKTTSAASADGAGDKEHDGDNQLVVATPATLDDYFEAKLVDWITQQAKTRKAGSSIPSVAVVAPDADQDAGAIAREALAVVRSYNHLTHSVLVDIPAVHFANHLLQPKEILYYILRELKLEDAKSLSHQQQQQQQQEEGTGQDERERQYIEWKRKDRIYREKKNVFYEVKRTIREMKVGDKIEEIKSEFGQSKNDELLQWNLKKLMKEKGDDKNIWKSEISKKPLQVLLLLLVKSAAADEQDQVRKKAMPTLAVWYDDIIKETAKKLQDCMDYKEEEYDEHDDDEEEEEDDDDEEEEDDDEEEEEGGEGRGQAGCSLIHLNAAQYEQILREVFPKTMPLQEQEQGTPISPTTPLGEDKKKVIIEKVKPEIVREVLSGTSNSKSPQAQEQESSVARQVTKATTTALDEDPTTEKSNKKQAAGKSDGHDEDLDATVQENTKTEKAGTSNSKSLRSQEQDSLADKQATKATVTAVGDDPIKKKSNKKQRAGKSDGHDQKLDAIVQETMQKMEKVKQVINEQLKIKGIMDMIEKLLKDQRIIIILKFDDQMIHGFRWEETRNALSFLDCIAGAVIVINSRDTQQIKEEYCYPQQQEPINYSLVGLYHDTLFDLTRQQYSNCDPQIFHNILDKCKLNEFCMKIFAHALYANPKRSNEELNKLHSILQPVSPEPLVSIAKTMFMFCYNDLPKEYKSCLLYLAIFPQGYKIRRSTLIGRWVAEGVITTEDWRWSSSVREAEKCFVKLIDRWLVYPVDIGATGEVKSCMVDNLVHGFITKIAEKQRILETRLSHHLARHFSISNDLRLRGSDTIENFLENLSKSSQFHLLKVLDLEDCQCFGGKKKRYLKDICSKILLLKYLSLRRTNVTHLPSEINNLHELEVLDIRQTKVPAFETRNIRLLKLKRLLAGDTAPSLNSTDFDSVQVPEKIEKMEAMEVLSNVKPQDIQHLKDIGRLWQLSKLGVVIKDKDSHLKNLLQAISNLHKCLRSLSITLVPITERMGTSCSRGFSILQNAYSSRLPVDAIDSYLKDHPKDLETLSISGSTRKVQLLQLLAQDGEELAKVTISKISLNQNDLNVLANLPKLRCFRLRHIVCAEGKLTFSKDKFENLKYFLSEGSNMTDISFEAGATPGLEEIVLSFPTTNTIGVDGTPDLEERKLNNSTSTNTATAAAATTANTTRDDALPKLEERKLSSNTTTAAAVTTGDDGLPKLEEHELSSNTAAAAAAAANTATTAPAATSISTAAAATTTRVNVLPKPQEQKLNSNTTSSNMFLSLFQNNAKQISKVTLGGTLLKQGDLQILAKKRSMRCLELLEKSYVDGKLTFNNDEFPKLNLLTVQCCDISEISFTGGSAPKLEKIIWSFSSLSGIDNLPRLKELEFNGELVPNEVQVKESIKNHRNKLVLKYNIPKNQEQEKGRAPKEGDVANRSHLCFWMKKA